MCGGEFDPFDLKIHFVTHHEKQAADCDKVKEEFESKEIKTSLLKIFPLTKKRMYAELVINCFPLDSNSIFTLETFIKKSKSTNVTCVKSNFLKVPHLRFTKRAYTLES